MKAPVLLLLLLATATTLAQTPAVVVQCRIVAEADSMPLRRARVTVIADGQLSQPVFSGDDGRCEASISSPSSILRVSKAGYAPQDVRVTPRPAAPIEIRLAPAAVVSGRVTDNRGQAAVRVAVTIRRIEPRDAPQPAEMSVVTDNRGEYRLGNLIAGRYALHTQRGMALADGPPASRSEQALEPMSDTLVVDVDAGQQRDVALAHNAASVAYPYEEGGVVTGTLFDEHGEPAEGARVVLLALADTGMGGVPPEVVADDRGQFRVSHVPPGPHLVVVTHPTEGKAPPGGPGTIRLFGAAPEPGSYLPVYYPGTLDAGEAVPVLVERNQELQAIDMVVPMARGSRVFGSISNGSAVRTPLELRPTDRSATARAINRLATASADGDFEFRDVSPGTYVLQHVSTENGEPPETGSFMFASVRLTVGGDDIGPVTLTPAPTSILRGRISLEGGAAVFATDRRRWFSGSPYLKTSAPRSDGRFTVTSLPPGDYFVGAIEYSESNPDAGDVLKPDNLTGLARTAQRISVVEGQQQSVELRLIRLSR